jgi:hypothetical protein
MYRGCKVEPPSGALEAERFQEKSVWVVEYELALAVDEAVGAAKGPNARDPSRYVIHTRSAR